MDRKRNITRSAILLSGGIDSTAIAYWIRPKFAITIDYGQASAKGEIRAATKVASRLRIRHEIISVDCSALGAGDLALAPQAKDAPAPEWWPFRNQLLVTLAAMRAYALGCSELIVGSLKSDSFHLDGTKAFYRKLDAVLSMQEGNIRISVPAISFTAMQLIKTSRVPISLLGWTHSCHKAEYACGQCRGCNKHLQVMEELLYDT